jgi:hypothetical protein
MKNLWGLGIGDWGLGIGDWAWGPIPNPQSPIPNPQSPFFIFLLKLLILKILVFDYYYNLNMIILNID